MKYGYFIGMLRHHETDRIRCFNGSQQTNPEYIPTAFALLIPEIITILTANLNEICGSDQGIVIFGLQPASGMITSNKPLEQERFIDGLQLDYHFCCTLDFFKVPIDELDRADNWHCTDAIVIDFTSGELMDSDRFLSKLQSLPEKGRIYGHIKESTLRIIWAIAKIKQAKEKNTGFLFNNLPRQEVA